jgi:hypothetical protein
MNYETITDARTELQNSGVFEWFDFDVVDQQVVADWMWRNNATPEQAAEHFQVA